ncbi:hypothetical protein FN846DRAFT_890289 [Sphaerosporella brunnea]|uniref:ARS-binding protein 1 N-terminal domain-containing protein n=1 Tax=Sphaerosporella brunnea TaxID=1250544 RepID=A0A5J5EWF0_9PEZI|nr:hypothetical protein FN846DRAFT_890289 [Sphaerosporella brunnea]
MAEQPAATPVVKKEFNPVTPMGAKVDHETTTPREASDANSPDGQGQQKKRKYEEATEDEKLALNEYHIQNPHLKQRELAEWFKAQYGKSINQSTVSRNLKKFKASSPSKGPGSSRPEATPTRRERKLNNSRSPPQKKIQISKQLIPNAPSAVSLPPTPPPRDNKSSPIDSALYEIYLNYQKVNPNATTEECDRHIKLEARNLMANVRPLPHPSPDKLHSPIIDDAWVANWKRVHGILSPSSAAGGFAPGAAIPEQGHSGSEADRTCSEDTEPRSPVSTVSSSDHRSIELPSIKDATGLTLSSAVSSTQPNGTAETPENARKMEIEQLRMEIVKRDQRIENERRKKEAALRKLEKLEKAGGTGIGTGAQSI